MAKLTFEEIEFIGIIKKRVQLRLLKFKVSID